jgi:N-sulfoglucosamine sulfohydrolase
LRKTASRSDTIVFFWGDHGRGLTRAKRWIWDSGVHVPLMVRWPGQLKPGSATRRLVSLMDLGPTVMSLAGIPTPPHMHGRSFLGPHAAAPRQYVHLARDRKDETPDTIRGVRDVRWKYLRNYRPELPWSQPIKYMDEMPMLQEMRRLNAEGKLTGPPALWFAPTKPAEELYDCDNDPHEINNLAADPRHRAKLKELRAEHERWRRQYPDLTALPETELMERMRPGGVWQTAPEPTVQTAKTSAGVRVNLGATTPGVRIAWTTEAGANPRWQVYSKPLDLSPGVTLRAKSCRLGWHDSAEVATAL